MMRIPCSTAILRAFARARNKGRHQRRTNLNRTCQHNRKRRAKSVGPHYGERSDVAAGADIGINEADFDRAESTSAVATFRLCGEGWFRKISMQTEFTRELIEQAFDEMGTLAAARGITIEIAVYGGSCLILASDIRNASGDVDAVFLAGGAAVREIADAVAARLNLTTDWINESVKRMAPPPGDPQPNLMLSGEYPRVPNSMVGLRVHLPSPAYILAMKILANRGPEDTEKTEVDLNDAVALMKVTKITTEQLLVDLLKECYPNLPGIVFPTVHPRIKTKIEILLDAYRKAESEPDPTWHAGTGPATRP